MQLTPSLIPSDPALLATVLPAVGVPHSSASTTDGRPSACGAFGELFPELGATPTATALPAPAAAAPVSPAAWPVPADLYAPGTLPATPRSFSANANFTATAVRDEPAVDLAPEGERSPGPKDCVAARRGQPPLSRRFSEKHGETVVPSESPAPAALGHERAVADLAIAANPALPAAPEFEPIAALPDAAWGLETAATPDAESGLNLATSRPGVENPSARKFRPPSQSTPSAPSMDAIRPQVSTEAISPRIREHPAIAPTQEAKSALALEPRLDSRVSRAPDAEARASFSWEFSEDRMPINPSAPGANPEIATHIPDVDVRAATHPIVADTRPAAVAPPWSEPSVRLPESTPVARAMRSVEPASTGLAPVALGPAPETISTDARILSVDATVLAEDIAARGLGELPAKLAPKRPLQLAAKFAADAMVDAGTEAPARDTSVKTFVNAAPESLTRHRPELGIGVAKPAATMSERLIPAFSPHPMPEYGTVVPVPEGRFEPDVAATFTPAPENAPVETVSSAQRAVDVALRAVDVAGAGEQKAVNLDFAVGDADLNVRIEIRADEVHATFRTDSAELRTALAQEWQSVASSPSAERTLRLAPATFTSADASAFNASGDPASSRERHAQAQHGESPPAAFAATGRARAAASDHSVSAATAIRSLVAAATSRHLHTLA